MLKMEAGTGPARRPTPYRHQVAYTAIVRQFKSNFLYIYYNINKSWAVIEL